MTSTLFLALFFIAGTDLARASDPTSPWDARVLKITPQGPEESTWTELARDTARVFRDGVVVLGEEHSTPRVQELQARLIRETISAAESAAAGADTMVPPATTPTPSEPGTTDRYTLAWEFLNWSDRTRVQESYASTLAAAITQDSILDLIRVLFTPTAETVPNWYRPYAPVLETAAQTGAELLTTNLTRAEKKPVVQGGITAADPALVPPGFEMGSDAYHRRFVAAMEGGHATLEQIENYYAAQCLTDDVMAFHIAQDAAHASRFLVVGGFHTDYRDGVVRRLAVRMGSADRVATLRFINAANFTPDEWETFLQNDLVNGDLGGAIADYVIVASEPQGTSP